MALIVKGISKRFGNIWALRDVSLSVENGEIFGVLGPADSGKSVLLDILADSIQPSSGTVGTDSDKTPREANVVRLSNNSSKRSNLFSIFSRRRSFGTVTPTDLEKVIRSTFENTSFVLLDEPFSGVDLEGREFLSKIIRDLSLSSASSVVFASRRFYDISLLCDRVAVLVAGEIVQTGSPKEIYENPVSPVAAILTGRMNLFEGRRISSSKAEIPEFITINGEHRIYTRKSGLNRFGAMNRNITLGIRPEDIHISFGASFPEDNLLRAVVADERFFGAYTLVTLNAGGLTLRAQVNKLVGLGVGEECMISLPPERIHYL